MYALIPFALLRGYVFVSFVVVLTATLSVAYAAAYLTLQLDRTTLHCAGRKIAGMALAGEAARNRRRLVMALKGLPALTRKVRKNFFKSVLVKTKRSSVMQGPFAASAMRSN